MYNSGSTDPSNTVAADALWAHAFGLRVVNYEGGFNIGGDNPTDLQKAANLDPQGPAVRTPGRPAHLPGRQRPGPGLQRRRLQRLRPRRPEHLLPELAQAPGPLHHRAAAAAASRPPAARCRRRRGKPWPSPPKTATSGRPRRSPACTCSTPPRPAPTRSASTATRPTPRGSCTSCSTASACSAPWHSPPGGVRRPTRRRSPSPISTPGLHTLSLVVDGPGQVHLLGGQVTHTVSVANPGFESIYLAGGYAANPNQRRLDLSGTSGIAGNRNTLTSGNPAAPEGGQVAFLGPGDVSESVSTGGRAPTSSASSPPRKPATPRRRPSRC